MIYFLLTISIGFNFIVLMIVYDKLSEIKKHLTQQKCGYINVK